MKLQLKRIQEYFESAVVALIVLACCSVFETADAAFLDMPSIGGRAFGTAGAMTALADDPVSALFYNPAGLSDIPGRKVEGGATVVYFPAEYKSPTGYKTKNGKISVVPYFGMSNDRFAPIYFGIGLYGSLGIGFDYDRDQRYGINHDFTSEMGNMYLSPTMAYRITDTLSIGAGLNITYGKLEMGMPIGAKKFHIDTDGFCYGVNLGVLYKPCQYINLGLRWRSRMKADLKGDARFGGTEDDVTAHMYWADLVTFGLGVHASPKLIILCDLEWIDYSRFSRKSHLTYDRLTNFNAPFLKDMRDARRLHLGCEYSASEKIILRVGYLYNPWCVPKAQTSLFAPGNTYHTIHLGTNVKITESFHMEITANRAFSSSRKVTNSETGFPGTYRTPCCGINIGLSYIF